MSCERRGRSRTRRDRRLPLSETVAPVKVTARSHSLPAPSSSRPESKVSSSSTPSLIEDPPEGIVVYTDGSCIPGRASGIGIFYGNGHPLNTSKPLTGPKHDSGIAEVVAAKTALQQLLDWNGYKGELVTLRTDFMDLISTVNQGRLYRSDLAAEYEELKKLAERFPKGVTFEHVYAHDGIEGNERADELARAAIKLRPKSTPPERRGRRSRSRSRSPSAHVRSPSQSGSRSPPRSSSKPRSSESKAIKSGTLNRSVSRSTPALSQPIVPRPSSLAKPAPSSALDRSATRNITARSTGPQTSLAKAQSTVPNSSLSISIPPLSKDAQTSLSKATQNGVPDRSASKSTTGQRTSGSKGSQSSVLDRSASRSAQALPTGKHASLSKSSTSRSVPALLTGSQASLSKSADLKLSLARSTSSASKPPQSSASRSLQSIAMDRSRSRSTKSVSEARKPQTTPVSKSITSEESHQARTPSVSRTGPTLVLNGISYGWAPVNTIADGKFSKSTPSKPIGSVSPSAHASASRELSRSRSTPPATAKALPQDNLVVKKAACAIRDDEAIEKKEATRASRTSEHRNSSTTRSASRSVARRGK